MAEQALSSRPGWIDEAEYIIDKLWNLPGAQPFKAPVDPVALGIPDYLVIIKQPMDFKTIKEKLANNSYETERAFVDDVQLVFSNCALYNTPQSLIASYGRALKKEFETLVQNSSLLPNENGAVGEADQVPDA
eukprot:TRINITY_DN420_c0_g1_i11.p2 TRINITY_DN420_c0_g1~~TRINITY_DN420_c0_g1_i11.p2  ORF type:complete len:133 (+),score=13.37 TRINITY_DN420_c0_g1_i11:173-571(+)